MARMRPSRVDRGADAVELLARMIGGDEMLAPVLDPFHRPAEPHGARRRRERPPDRSRRGCRSRRPHATRARWIDDGGSAEHAREQVAVAVRHLGGAVQLENVAWRRRSGRCRRALPAARRNGGRSASSSATTVGRRAQRRVDVAVALADDRRLGVAAGRELARLGLGGEQHGQLLDLDADEVGGVLGGIGIVARTPPPPARRHSARARARARAGGRARAPGSRPSRKSMGGSIGNVGRGPHRHHARQRARGGGVDRHDVAVRMVRAHHAHVQLMGKGNVAGKAAAPRTSGGSSSRSTDRPIHLLRGGIGLDFQSRRRALQRPPRDGAGEVAAVLGAGERIIERIDGGLDRLGGSNKGGMPGRTSRQRGFGRAMRRGCASTLPTATRGSRMTPSSTRKVASAMASAKSPARRLNS